MSASPPNPLVDARARTGTLVAMCLSLILVVGSVASVNLALTEISIDLGTTSSQLTWVADGYTVALAALVLPFGALGDRFGRRTFLLLGSLVFALGALGAALAQSPTFLIACRVVMGVGASMIMPGTLSTITAVFPAAERSRAVSVWAGVAASGAVLGLLGCGTLLEWWSWRSTFAATAILAVLSFLAAALLAPNTADPDGAVIDLPGYVLSGIGVGAVVFAIIDGAEAGWTASTAIGASVIAGASLAAFVWWSLHTERPMLDVRLFGRRGFGTGSLAVTTQFLCLYGFFLVGMPFLQLILGYSALHSALCLLPMAAIVMPMSRVAPLIVERVGARVVMTAGLLFLAAGMVTLARLDADSTYWPVLVGLILVGVGMAGTSTPATTAIVSALPAAKQGVGSAVNDVSREVGSALGIAVLGSLFNRAYAGAVGPAAATLPGAAGRAVRESPGVGLAFAARLGPDGRQLHEAVRDAFATGLRRASTAGAIIAVITAVVMVWRGPHRRTIDATTGVDEPQEVSA